MSVASELRTFVLADATVSGLVGARMYPNLLPQKPIYPAIVYQQVSGPRDHDVGGTLARARRRFQLRAVSDEPLEALNLAAAIRSRLDRYSGLLTTVRVAILIEDERDGYEDDPDLHSVVQDYRVASAD